MSHPQASKAPGEPNPWDRVFRDRGRVFLQPQEDIPALAAMLRARGATALLDLGSGTGRHVIFFARQGFTVYGFDESPEGVAMNAQWLAEEGLAADLRTGNMLDGLPYDDALFDAVVSTQVIHHGTIAAVQGIIREITRVLKPNGVAFVTVTGKRDQGSRFEEIEPNTLIPLDGNEAGLPHHYFTPDELRAAFADAYDVRDVHTDRTHHLCLTAIRR